jgi:hypothetical protein
MFAFCKRGFAGREGENGAFGGMLGVFCPVLGETRANLAHPCQTVLGITQFALIFERG